MGLTMKDNLARSLGLIEGLTKERLLIGIPGETTDRQPDADDPSPPNNATIARVQEFGSPALNIPARPFLVPGVENAKERIGDIYEDAARAALKGRAITANQAHHAAGLVAQAAVRAKLTDGPFAPLSPVTIAKRKAKGRFSTRPLIDSGQLRAAVNYVVRPADQTEA